MLHLAMALAAQGDPAAMTLPRAMPPHGTILIEHRDVRAMPGGGRATFREGSLLDIEPAGDALIITMQATDRSCEGPPPICRTFLRLGGAVDGQRIRFRLNLADYGITLLGDAGVPLPNQSSGTASQISAAVTEREGTAPGSVLAADLRQLLRFAGLTLPDAGAWVDAPEGRLQLRTVDARSVTLAISRPGVAGGATVLNGSGECRVSRSTGLVEQCRYVDWMGDDAAHPVRERSVNVSITPRPVS